MGPGRRGWVSRPVWWNSKSGGHRVQLPAHTEGVAEEGQSPEKRLMSFELNEMVRLIRGTDELAARLNQKAGSPAIIQCKDGSTAAIWTAVYLDDLRETGNGQRSLRLKSPASRARLFTLDGREIPARAEGATCESMRPRLAPAYRTTRN